MQGKVVLEEHFAIPETLQDSAGFAPEADWPELRGRLLDIQERRLREMDAHGIEVSCSRSTRLLCRQYRIWKKPTRSPAGRTISWPSRLPASQNVLPASPHCRCRRRSL